jgi:hypothetical protein
LCYFKTILSIVLLNCPQAEIEKYKAEREKAFAEYEAKFSGAKDDIAARYLQWLPGKNLLAAQIL